MSEEDRHLLVVGGDSTLGGAILQTAKDLRWPCAWTSRRSSRSAGSIPFDLRRATDVASLLSFVDGNPPRSAIICAAVSSFRACAADPTSTSIINVTHSLDLIRGLRRLGTHIVIPSTRAVFSGRSVLPAESDSPNPETEYGRQKAELEDGSLALGGVNVIRFTKILSRNVWFWKDLALQGAKGKSVELFGNVTIAPISSRRAALEALNAAVRRDGDIRHVTASDEVSYAAAARHIFSFLGYDTSLIQQSIANRNVYQGVFPDSPSRLGSKHAMPTALVALEELGRDFRDSSTATQGQHQ